MTELWKDVKGYEGLYQVSNKGRVRRDGRVLSTPPDSNGYCVAVLCKGGVRHSVKVHRIVAAAFLGEPFDGAEVNHIDEDKSNNSAENLEWCTRLQNIRHGTGRERRATNQRNRHGNKPIEQWSLCGNLIERYPSIREVTRRHGYDRAFIVRCANGKQRTAYGCIWQFANDDIKR